MSTSIDLTWGEQLLITVRRRHKKGLAPIVDYIRQVVGRGAGSRNSFAKLFDLATVNRLNDNDRGRVVRHTWNG